MPFNLPGTLLPLYALFNPRLLLPSLIIPDIRHLDFPALRNAGYRGAIFDKDNCLTLPHNDKLVPGLEDAWSAALRVFGPSHVLIVSNSAGTRDDPAQLQAESVARHLHAPVLLHAALKPSYSCAIAALSALPDLAPHEIIVVGDRVFTDVVLAHRLAHPRTPWARILTQFGLTLDRPRSLPVQDSLPTAGGSGEESARAPLAVLTTRIWQRESMVMRLAEATLMRLVERWIDGARERRDALEERFVRRTLDNDNEKDAEKPVRGWFS
ncbi:mitochondrial PGP phosphatase-domain-containing protein [Multifurca ochricompacta]|uniref:Mitochondrial PGP phosphatase-domain-containing protein n=1 Tax=Multifurca ochricompacta TaxID=376703 RepID=A0AAD4M3T8_9AGAM|nr:mitochondrial PGP phosphatase-domain-containing protein [Multifurca ochricompacta]